jgi:hypothetical protein
MQCIRSGMSRRWKKHLPVLALLISLMPLAQHALAQNSNAVVSGEFTVERPTLMSLGFDWKIQGDDNRTAAVEVSYRKAGTQAWTASLPLLRLQREQVNGGDGNAAYVTPNMFSGSILNLEPDADYECHFVLKDTDGVQGEAEKTVTVHTRKEPMPAAGGNVFHVYPIGYTGPRQEPSFTGIFAAYYLSCHTSDFEDAFPTRVKPGDTILVHAGVYMSDRVPYTSSAVPPSPTNLALCTLFDGTYYFSANGTADKPIVIKGAGDGDVIFDGNGAHILFNLMAASYNYFEGITIRNTDVAFLLGSKNIAGASGFTLKHSHIENVSRAVQDDWAGSKDFYIADNEFIGRHNPDKLLGWSPQWQPYPGYPELLDGPTGSEYAVKVYGQGHVIAYNSVTNWHDGIDIAVYGNPDEDASKFPSAIDLYRNDFSNLSNSCIVAGGGGRNIRIFQNQCFNTTGGAFAAEPIFGGPAYIYRNLAYNTTTAGALNITNNSAGILVFQNTFLGNATISAASNIHFLNNLIVGGSTPGPIFAATTSTKYSASDYNGFRLNKNTDHDFEWNAADPHPYKSLQEYSNATRQDTHSVQVDYDVFENAKIPDATDLQRLYHPYDYDFRLKKTSAAVDAGTLIPGITDGFMGKAPDLGAFELGQPIPTYGPRPIPGAHIKPRWSGGEAK